MRITSFGLRLYSRVQKSWCLLETDCRVGRWMSGRFRVGFGVVWGSGLRPRAYRGCPGLTPCGYGFRVE